MKLRNSMYSLLFFLSACNTVQTTTSTNVDITGILTLSEKNPFMTTGEGGGNINATIDINGDDIDDVTISLNNGKANNFPIDGNGGIVDKDVDPKILTRGSMGYGNGTKLLVRFTGDLIGALTIHNKDDVVAMQLLDDSTASQAIGIFKHYKQPQRDSLLSALFQ